MARPSKTYPSERAGKPCGSSWPDSLRVTGKIPGLPFGNQFEVVLQPVALANDMRSNQGMLSWRGKHETRVRDRLERTIDQVLADAQKFRWRIGEENYQAVRNLLALAQAELAYVDITHETWQARRWGLERLSYAAECDARGGPGPGEPFAGGFDRCPSLEEIGRRIEARDYIVERYVDACHFIRCAQFGLWRVWLYRRARDEWSSTPQGGAPDGLAPPPPKTPRPKGVGSFTAQPPGPPPPPTPPKPPTPEPPPFPVDLGGGDGLPDPGEPEPPDEDDVPAPPLPEPLPEPPSPPVVEPKPPMPPQPEPVGESPVGESPVEPRDEGPTITPLGGGNRGPSGAEPMGQAPTYAAHAAASGRPWPQHGGRPGTSSVQDVVSDGIDAGENAVVASAVARVATAAVVVGGLVGITYLVTRPKPSRQRKGRG